VTSYDVTPDMAAMHRRAAALFLHFRREGSTSTDGLLAVLDEMDDIEEVDGAGGADLPWVALVIALLDVGNQMASAARDGAERDYLEDVVRKASVTEAEGGDTGA